MSQAMCERCNPLGLKEPAPSQAHATVFIGIIAGVVLLAVVAKLMVSSVGPVRGLDHRRDAPHLRACGCRSP